MADNTLTRKKFPFGRFLAWKTSDVSGHSGRDVAESLENTGFAGLPVKKSATVDYYLTTVFEK